MDREFHYYMMYLVATKAGLDADNAFIIAYSSQYVDDNDLKFEIDKGYASAYRNYISQTMNILKPKEKLFRIYPLFHFIPGDPHSKTAYRKDGKMHWLNTTPNSKNANTIIDEAIQSGNFYRIGIACHSYADTWAHQNFVGYYDEFNAMKSPLANVTPNIGHADAQHNPDWLALVWRDMRLKDERRDNRKLFTDAAKHLFKKLIQFTDPKISKAMITKKTKQLIEALGKAIGERDQTNGQCNERIARYRELSEMADFGDRKLEVYDEDKWIEEAIKEKVRGLRDRSDITLARWDPLQDVYSWANKRNYKQSHWYCFQEAVKAHQNSAWDILSQSNLKGLELPQF